MLTSITDARAWTALCAGTLLQEGTRPIERLSIDSREDCKNALFIALKGACTDGHRHIPTALQKGASALLVSTPPANIPAEITVILVADTVRALQDAAVRWKAEVKPTCIAVTGSVGKTTTKELLAAILQQSAPTFASPENKNTEIGVPLSVLAMPRGTKFLICEFGMRAQGEIRFLSQLLRPDMGILTCIGTSHLETLGSRSAIAEAKMELLCGMNGGTLVYDGEEPLLLPLRTCHARSVPVFRSLIIKLGVHGEKTNFAYGGVCYTLCGVGAHLLYDSVLALTAARLLGLDVNTIREGLQHFQPAAGRQELRHLANKITLIADHYNASPESMEASIQALCELAGGRMIAILGGMLELGTNSVLYHEALGRVLAARKISMLWCVGEEAKDISRGALAGGMDQSCIHLLPFPFDVSEITSQLLPMLSEGDTLLIKGSRKFKLEALSSALIEQLAK